MKHWPGTVLACALLRMACASPSFAQEDFAAVPAGSSSTPAKIAPADGTSEHVAEKAPTMQFSNGTLSVAAKDVDVRALFDRISLVSGVEIRVESGVEGRATVDFKDVVFEEAMELVLKAVDAGLFWVKVVKGAVEQGGLQVRWVLITTRNPKLATDPTQRVIRVTEILVDRITVQDAVGKEVVFAKRGNGPGEIPLPEREIEIPSHAGSVVHKIVRGGLRLLRFCDDGSLYLIGGSRTHFFAYDASGKQRAIPWPQGNWPYVDTDHEGNVYFMTNHEVSQMHSVEVLMLNRNGKEIARVTVPPQDVTFSRWFEIDDAALKARNLGTVYDFRKYLGNPDRHAANSRYRWSMKADVGADDELTVNNAPSTTSQTGGFIMPPLEATIGLRGDFITVPLPSGWKGGRDSGAVLGVHKDGRIFALVCVHKTWSRGEQPVNRYDNYAIAVVDPLKNVTNYYKINQLDTFVYEFGEMSQEHNRFDMDAEGNVYHVFTTKEGTHVYKYALGVRP